MVGQQNVDIADTLHLRDVAIATIFCLAIYGIYIGSHLVNTTEPSVCGNDTGLCQNTLTTCYDRPMEYGSHYIFAL